MMRNNRIKIILWLTVFVFACLTLFVFGNTLAVFENNSRGRAEADIGKWVIKLSDELISDGLNEEIVIDSFVYSSQPGVASGYIAPGGSAYFDLIFDATECDVAVKYDVSFNFESIDYSENISISVQELGESQTIKTAANTYSGVIDLESISNEEVITLRVSITWDDLEAFDESDTELGTTVNSKLAVPINVRAVQYLGETITPYVEPEPEPEPGGGEGNGEGNGQG